MELTNCKPLYWATGAKEELLALPQPLVRNFGYALSAIQLGRSPATSVKALHNFALPVLELRASGEAGTYRVVYCAALGSCIYVLHCFQKKSPSGSKIARTTLKLIDARLKEVRAYHEQSNSTP